MKLQDGAELTLLGRHFLVNIARPEKTPDGVAIIQRDPRKDRLKADCYVGVVEEVGTQCTLVKPGMRIVFERWEWQQMNVDDERLIAREKDVMIIGENTPAPGIMILELMDVGTPKTNIVLPQTLRPEEKPYYHGKVVATSANQYYGLVGEEIFVEKYDSGQFRDGQGRLIFRTDRVAFVLMRVERTKEPVLTVI